MKQLQKRAVTRRERGDNDCMMDDLVTKGCSGLDHAGRQVQILHIEIHFPSSYVT